VPCNTVVKTLPLIGVFLISQRKLKFSRPKGACPYLKQPEGLAVIKNLERTLVKLPQGEKVFKTFWHNYFFPFVKFTARPSGCFKYGQAPLGPGKLKFSLRNYLGNFGDL
jgi:hypothetical protein